MKALLGMAKERRKDQDKEFKPIKKLNLPQRQVPAQSQEQYPDDFGEQDEEEYQPNDEQIISYADYIGIKLPQEEDLLDIAREGLMASLPPDWDQHEEEDGNILYVNRRTGQVIAEHPCDEYYRQLVVKERKKKGSKFGIQPVGYSNISNPSNISKQSKVMAQAKKQMDPLVKMQVQKKKKKLQQQKRKQYSDKKNQIKQKYALKKQNLQKQLKTKQKKISQKYEQQIENEKIKINKKMSQQQKMIEQKNKKQMDKFERETRAKLQIKYFDKRTIEKQKIQKNMKAKRQQIRIALQSEAKSRKKQIQDAYKEKLKILSDKQKSLNNQKSTSDLLNQQIQKIKQQIIQKKIKQHSQRIQQQRQIQEAQFKATLIEIQRVHEEKVKNLQVNTPKNEIKFDSIIEQVEQIEKTELQALQYELLMTRELKRAQKQQNLQKYKRTFLQQKRQDLQRLQRENNILIEKLRKAKQEQYLTKLSESQKNIKQTYLGSLKELNKKFVQEQEIIQIQNKAINNGKHHESRSFEMMNQVLQKMGWKQKNVRMEIEAVKKQINRMNTNKKAFKHKMNEECLRMYELIVNKIGQA